MMPRPLLFVLLLMVASSVARAEPSPPPLTTLDGLEYRLEIDRHRQLIETRRRPGATLAPFVSDGCSGGLSAGWALVSKTLPAIAVRHGDHPPWEKCCLQHDRLYHFGGPPNADAAASFAARQKADVDLRMCVIRTGVSRAAPLAKEYGIDRDEVAGLYQLIADVMYRAVRLGGAPCSSLSWRWGFGWPHCGESK